MIYVSFLFFGEYIHAHIHVIEQLTKRKEQYSAVNNSSEGGNKFGLLTWAALELGLVLNFSKSNTAFKMRSKYYF